MTTSRRTCHILTNSGMVRTDSLLQAFDRPLELAVSSSPRQLSIAQLGVDRGHHARSASSASNTSSIHSISESGEEDDRPAPSTSALFSGPSGLDRLLAKLAAPFQPQPLGDTSGSETTAASLMASISGPPRTMSVPPPSSSAVSAPTRGLALLDTIFASATSPPPRAASRAGISTIPPQRSASQSTSHSNRILSYSNPPQYSPPTALSQDLHILSPKPTSTALPQVLNQEVISTLLGLPPSRASSVRYEGDNEASDDGASEPGSLTASIPQLSLPTTRIGDNESVKPGTRILGDVTPRPTLRGFGSNISQVSDLLTAARIEQQNTHVDTTSSGSAKSTIAVPADSESTPTIYAQFRVNPTSTTSTSKNALKPRPLVPFETDSELWPYPRPPLIETDSDVIELDFADMSVLSDPDAFEKHTAKGKKPRRSKKDQQKEREEIEKSWDVPAPVRVVSPAPGPRTANMPNGKAKRAVQPECANNAAPKPDLASAPTDAPKLNINGTQSALLSSLASQDNADRLRNLSRKDFVTEVLSLIYVRHLFPSPPCHTFTHARFRDDRRTRNSLTTFIGGMRLKPVERHCVAWAWRVSCVVCRVGACMRSLVCSISPPTLQLAVYALTTLFSLVTDRSLRV